MFSVSGSVKMSEINKNSKTPACDLGALLEAGDAALVTLVAGEMQLAVHRSVLVAKSPVFAAMLTHDTVEASSGRIVIADVEPEVLQELVEFMYKDSIPQLCSMASQLLVAADKYCMPVLKALCEQQMVLDLSVENVLTSASFALRHSCTRLKEACGIFMQANFTRVMGTDGWAEKVSRHPEEFLEVSHLVAAKPAKPRADSQEELDQKLLKAAENDKPKEVQELLAFGADVGARDTKGRTALHFTVIKRSLTTLRVLLQHGADMNARDEDGRTALHYAATNNYSPTAACLLRAGACVEVVDKVLQTPLHCAVQGNNLDVVKLLLKAYSDVNTADVCGRTPLHLAAQWGNEDVVKALLDVGADKNARNDRRETPLHVAQGFNMEHLLAMLSVSGLASVTETNKNTKTPACNLGALLKSRDATLVTLVVGELELVVHRSVLVGKSPVFATMLAHNTVEDSCGRIVITDVEPKVVKQLVLFMYKDSAPQLCSMAPQLLVAADKYRMPDLKTQCELQLIRDLSVENVMTSALIALRHSCPSLMESCNVFIRTNFIKVVCTDGWAEAVHKYPAEFMEVSHLIATPSSKTRNASQEEMDRKLHKAAENNDYKEVEELLAKGADVAARDVRGRTALHSAIVRNMYSSLMWNYLLKAGADVGARDEDGRTALHYAAGRGNSGVSGTLLSAGARVDVRDRWLQTPLHASIKGNNLNVVQLLLAASSDTNKVDMYGDTPLHLVAQWGNADTVKALLDAGTCKDIRNDERETPADVAERCKREHLLALLK